MSIHSSPQVKYLTGIVVFLVLFLVRPFRFLRVGVLHGESLGGVISQADLVLAIRSIQQKSQSRTSIDIFVVSRSRANDHVVEQYVGALKSQGNTRIIDSGASKAKGFLGIAFRGLEFLAINYPGFRSHYCGSPLWEGIEGCGFIEDGRPWIRVRSAESMDCWQALTGLGISPSQKIICFGVRDATYWSRSRDPKVWGPLSDGGGSSQDFRNTNMADYLPSIEWLVASGYTVVRMGAGAPVSRDLDALGVIDYANSSQRSDKLDLFLFGQCHAAFFGGAFGLNQLALAQLKPTCAVNVRPFMFMQWSTDLCLLVPSLVENTLTGKRLTIEEMLRNPFHVASHYESAGLRFVPNSSLEILESISELLSRLEGTWRESGAQASLQSEFWEIVNRSQPGYALYSRHGGGTTRINSRFDIAGLSVTPRRSYVGSSFLSRHEKELMGR